MAVSMPSAVYDHLGDGGLTDRLGALPVAAAGATLLMGAGLLAAAAAHYADPVRAGPAPAGRRLERGPHRRQRPAGAVPVAQRPRVEGLGELGVGVAVAVATGLAGPVVGIAG